MKPKIVAIGEILWDVFPDGPRFGGAPANFACSAAELAKDNASVSLVSAIGDDTLGRDALVALSNRNVCTEAIQTNPLPTGRVDVELDEAGIASYTFAENCAWDHLTWSQELERLAASCDAVCFGTLGQRSAESRETIQRFIRSTPEHCLRVFDINIRPPFIADQWILNSLESATAIKLNEDELPIVAELCDCVGGEIEVLQHLSKRFELQLAALTRGERGSLILAGDQLSELSGRKVQVIDTVGAGDAFTASMVLDMLGNTNIETMNQRANALSSYVCTQAGATMAFPENLTD